VALVAGAVLVVPMNSVRAVMPSASCGGAGQRHRAKALPTSFGLRIAGSFCGQQAPEQW